MIGARAMIESAPNLGSSWTRRLVAPSAQPLPLNLLDQPPVPTDRLVQLLVLTLLNEVCENPEHAPCAAVKSQLCDRQVALVDRIGHDASPLVDLPKTPEGKLRGHRGGS